jgi:hypothetical protein
VGIALSDSEKAEALAKPLETQIQPVTDPLFPAVMAMVDVALWSYFLMPTSDPSEPTLTRFRKPSDGYDGIPMNILKVSTPFITSPVIYKCNKSLSSGISPSRLKFSEIKPLHKKWRQNRYNQFYTYLFTYILLKYSGIGYIYKIVPTHQPK